MTDFPAFLTIRLTPNERAELEAFAAWKGLSLSAAMRRAASAFILPPREKPDFRPKRQGKNYERNQYLKEHPDMAGTRRRAPEAT